MIHDDNYYDEIISLAAQDRAFRKYRRMCIAHPDPRDPDFPGYEDEDDDDGIDLDEE